MKKVTCKKVCRELDDSFFLSGKTFHEKLRNCFVWKIDIVLLVDKYVCFGGFCCYFLDRNKRDLFIVIKCNVVIGCAIRFYCRDIKKPNTQPSSLFKLKRYFINILVSECWFTTSLTPLKLVLVKILERITRHTYNTESKKNPCRFKNFIW